MIFSKCEVIGDFSLCQYLKHAQNISLNTTTDTIQLLLTLPNYYTRFFFWNNHLKLMRFICCYLIFFILELHYVYSPAFLLFNLYLLIYMKFSHSVSRELIISVYFCKKIYVFINASTYELMRTSFWFLVILY